MTYKRCKLAKRCNEHSDDKVLCAYFSSFCKIYRNRGRNPPQLNTSSEPRATMASLISLIEATSEPQQELGIGAYYR